MLELPTIIPGRAFFHGNWLCPSRLCEKGIAATEAKMTAVDRLGFHLRLKTPDRVHSVRIGFPSEVRGADECRAALIAMVKRARSEQSPKAS